MAEPNDLETVDILRDAHSVELHLWRVRGVLRLEVKITGMVSSLEGERADPEDEPAGGYCHVPNDVDLLRYAGRLMRQYSTATKRRAVQDGKGGAA